jgi:dihydrofolate reductase
MRKVVSGLFISLDGVVEAPNKWQFDVFDDQLGEILTTNINKEDDILLGRVTYQEWAAYWPTATVDLSFADHMNNTPKHVVSSTLSNVDDWQNSTLVRDPATHIGELKQGSGNNIGVGGSPSVVQWLIKNNLLDELVLVVHPVIAGTGKRLFDDSFDVKRLDLTNNVTTGTGVVVLTYTLS